MTSKRIVVVSPGGMPRAGYTVKVTGGVVLALAASGLAVAPVGELAAGGSAEEASKVATSKLLPKICDAFMQEAVPEWQGKSSKTQWGIYADELRAGLLAEIERRMGRESAANRVNQPSPNIAAWDSFATPTTP